MNYLIIGGSSYSGKCTIQAIRETDASATIISTTSGEREVPGVEHTIHGIDLAQADAPERVKSGLADLAGSLSKEGAAGRDGGKSSETPPLRALIYIPARGEVGMPARLATKAQVDDAVDYCITPMLKMMASLQPELTVCYSGFITMDPLLQCYGAMSFVKIAMEDFVIRHQDRMRVIRFGMFPSNSVRGIGLLVQRNTMRKLYPEYEVMYDEWKASKKKFIDYFYDKNYVFEEKSYSHVSEEPFRPTNEQDIVDGVKFALNTEANAAPIVNVLGSWLWTDDAMPDLPPVIADNPALMPENLERHLQ
ncbi:MAG: hypothetical protein NXI24_01490 [bacterium]|nr:hypothetical protein [bacterium]